MSDRFFYVPELLLRPREPGCGETLVSLVSAEPGCHRFFASREPGPSIGPGNQSRASRMKGAWLRCIRATNQALTDPCAAGGRSHGRGGGNKRRRGGMGLPESGSRRRCAACHCADALVRLELGLGQFGGAGHMTRKFLMPLRSPGCVWRFGKQDGPTQYLVVSGAAQV